MQDEFLFGDHASVTDPTGSPVVSHYSGAEKVEVPLAEVHVVRQPLLLIPQGLQRPCHP
jgi:hypothetical protein